MTIGIYCIENMIDGKRYIGKSVNVKHRLQVHKWNLSQETRPVNCNRYLYAAVQKYGIDNFHFGLVEDIGIKDPIRLAERELYWQDFYLCYLRQHGYNLLRESAGVIEHSKETKILIGNNSRGRPVSDKTRELLRLRSTGRRHTDATKKLIGDKKIGKPRSPETLLKMSISMTGKQHTEETKQLISKIQTGKPQRRDVVETRRERQSKYSYVQYTLDGKIVNIFNRLSDLYATEFSFRLVSAVCNGKRNHHKGFIWKKIPKIT